MKFLLIIPLIYLINAEDDDVALCTARSCTDNIQSSPCPTLADECTIQNSTYNGLILPSPDPCNCCTYCLVNLKERDFCSAGDIGGLVPDSMCGPGLTCDPDSETCVEMVDSTECTKEKYDYETRRVAGTLGAFEVRPNCDDSGFYQPYKCIPGQNCFCVDRYGKRIFGEITYSNTAPLTMKCGCSRKYDDIVKFIGRSLHPNEHFRCTDNGDYDTIQCIGDNCMCTDTSDGAATFPTNATVNISSISSTTLKNCFKSGVHLEGRYYYECAQKYIELLEEVKQHKKDDGYDAVFEVNFPNCDITGKYAPVQKDLTTNTLYCANTDGTPIQRTSTEIYSAPLSEMDTMNCYCARTMLLLSEHAVEKPDCCANGNFNPVQCRRGKCFCVDDNGLQNEVEVDANAVSSLSCYNNACNSAL